MPRSIGYVICNVLVEHSIKRRRGFVTNQLIRWSELSFLAIFLLIGFWFFYQGRCDQLTCILPETQAWVELRLFQIGMIIWATFNASRLAMVYLLQDKDEEKETSFYFGLAGLWINYLIIALFLGQFFNSNTIQVPDSPILIAQILAIGGTLSLLLADKGNWDKSTFFVKFRISVSMLHIILMVVNPFVGIFAWFLMIPSFTLLSDYITS